MARRWWKIGHLKPGEKVRAQLYLRLTQNGFQDGGQWFCRVCTAVVMVVFAATKFADGAWIILLLTPTLVIIFFTIHHHYKNLASHLSLEDYGIPSGFFAIG